MLDQNTDRMWYVIGAIVIGAAIIAMGLNIFSDSFDSVDDNFASVIGVADSNINNIGFENNILTTENLITSLASANIETVDLFELTVLNATNIDTNPLGGVIVDWRAQPFIIGQSYHMSFNYRKIGGELLSFGGHSPIGVVIDNIRVDGLLRDTKLGDELSLYVEDDFDTHSISFDLFITDDYKPRGVGVNHESSLWLQPNRRRRGNVIVEFEDLRLVYR